MSLFVEFKFDKFFIKKIGKGYYEIYLINKNSFYRLVYPTYHAAKDVIGRLVANDSTLMMIYRKSIRDLSQLNKTLSDRIKNHNEEYL